MYCFSLHSVSIYNLGGTTSPFDRCAIPLFTHSTNSRNIRYCSTVPLCCLSQQGEARLLYALVVRVLLQCCQRQITRAGCQHPLEPFRRVHEVAEVREPRLLDARVLRKPLQSRCRLRQRVVGQRRLAPLLALESDVLEEPESRLLHSLVPRVLLQGRRCELHGATRQ
eukprot:1184798-Prorocentrum_minimum.AAC.2